MMDGCMKTLEFSKFYAAKAHQTQRSGPVLGSLPSLQDIDEILQLQQRNNDALHKIRNAVINQEQALAKQRAQRQLYKSDHHGDEDHTGGYQEDFKGGGGFAGADAKKRRGVSNQSSEPFPPFEAVINIFHRKLLLLGVAIAAIELKPPNGAVGRMELVPCVTPVVCIMLS